VTAGQPVMTAKILEIQGILTHTGIILEIGIILIIGIHPGIIMTGILDVILTLGIRLIQVIRIDKPGIDRLKVLELPLNLDTIGILLDSVKTLVQGWILQGGKIPVMFLTRITLGTGILEMTPDADQTITLEIHQIITLDLDQPMIPRTGLTITLKIGLITLDNGMTPGPEMTTPDAHQSLIIRVHLETILGKILDIVMIGIGLIVGKDQVHLIVGQLTQVDLVLPPPSEGIPIVIQIPNILWTEHRVGTGWITSLERISFQT
jgi:hypothetical protein